jgi:transcriptional regulator with XRE-family HTH domain
MLTRKELVKKPEYWLETIQNEIFRQLDAYLREKNISQTQFAQQMGVTKGYISQVMKGEFNYTLKKLIEISLAIGKAPVIEFKPLDIEISQPNENTSSEDPLHDLNQVAEPFNNLKANKGNITKTE